MQCSALDGHRFIDERSPGGPADSASSHLISTHLTSTQFTSTHVISFHLISSHLIRLGSMGVQAQSFPDRSSQYLPNSNELSV